TCACGSGSDLVGLDANAGGIARVGTSAGVRPSDGNLCTSETDLFSSGFEDWGQTLSWSNDPRLASISRNRNGGVTAQLPFLRQDEEGTISVTTGGSTGRVFDEVMGSYTPRHYLKEQLTYDSGSGRFTLTDTKGDQLVFFGFGSGVPAAQRGQLEKRIDAAGNEADVSYDSS